MTSLQDLIGKTIVKIEDIGGTLYVFHTDSGESFTIDNETQGEPYLEFSNMKEWHHDYLENNKYNIKVYK
ncbi:MAG TPA: hypothetical protein VGD31_18460 [Sphingobacteriaceae bacterium]